MVMLEKKKRALRPFYYKIFTPKSLQNLLSAMGEKIFLKKTFKNSALLDQHNRKSSYKE